MKERKSKNCAACNFDLSDFPKESLDILNLCKKHKPKENKMDCPVCGCQDTKFVTGTAKATGRPWSAYDCQNPSCKNEKGYATRTFVKAQPNQAKFSKSPQAPLMTGNVDKKLDLIISMLKTLQGDMGVTEANKELSIEADQNTPF